MARGAAGKADGTGTSSKGRGAKRKSQVPFAYKLVLNQWMLALFGAKRFEELAEPLRSKALEGLDENNVHRFHHALTARLYNLTYLPTELLLEYDQNIVRHRQRLNERRISRGEAPRTRLFTRRAAHASTRKRAAPRAE